MEANEMNNQEQEEGLTDQENLAYKAKQIEEAHSELNRHFFRINHDGRDGDEGELMLWYIEHGGATGFALREKEHLLMMKGRSKE